MQVQPRDSELAHMSVCRQSQLIESKDLTPDQLVKIYLDRIRKHDPELKAFVDVYAEEAKALAECATIEIKSGFRRGPLHGIPIVVKDLIDIQGRQTTSGSVTNIGKIAERHARVVKWLLKEGAVILGKTQTVEFALGGWGTNYYMGTPKNPWNFKTHRVPGGSSSGSAVAVSAALASAGIGTDTGGSVRIPASMCGIVGFKPTLRHISTEGITPLAPTFDSVGPLARSVEDAALLYYLLSDFCVAPQARGRGAAARLESLKRGKEVFRLAVPEERELEGADEEILQAFFETVKAAEKLGFNIERVPLPISFSDCVDATSTIMSVEAYQHHGEWIEANERIDPHVRERVMSGKGVSAYAYVNAQETRKKNAALFESFMAPYDALLSPTTQMAAVPLDRVQEEKPLLAQFTRLANYVGGCALALPMGLTKEELPMSLQVIGTAESDDSVLRIGFLLEQRGNLVAAPPPAML